MDITLRDPADLAPYEGNPRTIPQAAIDKVARSLERFGWRQPIVVDPEGVIIAGHTRYLAARQLGMREVPVHVATDLSPEQIRAYRLADNRTAEETAWDKDRLTEELLGLGEVDLSEVTGFDPREVDNLLSGLDLGGEGGGEPSEGRPGGVAVPEIFEVIVACEDEEGQQALYERLTGEGFACRVLTA